MKKILFTALVVGLLVPTAAFAAAPAQNPASYCKAHPELIGAGKLHKNFGACAAAQSAKQEANTTNAAKTCKAEQALGADAFATKYGTNKNRTNAFGKCVSKTANAKTGDQQAAEVNAAKTCRTAENAAKIGAGKTWRNFGACVKAQTKTS